LGCYQGEKKKPLVESSRKESRSKREDFRPPSRTDKGRKNGVQRDRKATVDSTGRGTTPHTETEEKKKKIMGERRMVRRLFGPQGRAGQVKKKKREEECCSVGKRRKEGQAR